MIFILEFSINKMENLEKSYIDQWWETQELFIFEFKNRQRWGFRKSQLKENLKRINLFIKDKLYLSKIQANITLIFTLISKIIPS